MKRFILPFAETDLSQIYASYERERNGLGQRFMDEFARSIERILLAPEAAAIVQGDYRLRRLHKFPYGIVYLIEDDIVLIVAVYHLHRGPEFLDERLS